MVEHSLTRIGNVFENFTVGTLIRTKNFNNPDILCVKNFIVLEHESEPNTLTIYTDNVLKFSPCNNYNPSKASI